MQIQRTIRFLQAIKENNTRKWFNENKEEFLEIKAHFDEEINKAIAIIADFDPRIAHITAKDATYRFYRDTRFSPDKSPYKTHLGAYISEKGKKSLHGGYYIHLEPGHCLFAVGAYWLPTNILTACRNEIMANIDEWKQCVENAKFVSLFGKAGEGTWNSKRSFGLEHLKKCPTGFPKDYEYIEYLRMKDYCCHHHVDENIFSSDTWHTKMKEIFIVAKPMMDFVNNVIDDYE